MKNRKLRENIDDIGMIIVSLIFGCAYVFQSIGAKYLTPFAFNICKYIIALITIIPLCFKKTNTSRKDEIICGSIVGIILALFSYLQQVVAVNNNPGKIGFITSMYIVEVPLINFIFFKKRINLQTIISIVLATFGLMLLCGINNLSFNSSDLLTIVCSLMLAIQIIVLEKYGNKCNPLKLNMYGFIVTLIFDVIGFNIAGESISLSGVKQAIVPLIYVGFLCSTVGCSLQAFCQQTLDATICSLIMSLESVFSLIGGYFVFNETFSKTEIIGCVIMSIGVLLCITGQKKKKR